MTPLQKRNLWIYTLGRFVSMVGSGIQMIALPLYILDITGSGSMMGIFTMLSMVPALIISPFSGVLGDRWNRKKIMVNMDFARGFVIYILTLLAFFNKMSIPVLFASQIILSLMNSIFRSSTSAMLPELVDEEDFIHANSSQATGDSISMILGPVLGGIIYGLGGIKLIFLINATSYVLSAISEIFIVYKQSTSNTDKLSPQTFITEIKEVLSFISTRKGLKQLFTFAMLVNLILSPVFAIIMPYIFRQEIGFSAQQYGYLQAFFTVGFLLGNIAMALFLAKRMGTGKLMKMGMLVMPIFNIFFAFLVFPDAIKFLGGASWLLFSVLGTVFMFMGGFNSLVNTPLRTNLQKLVPNQMRSRFFSVLGVISQMAVPVGTLMTGFLLDLIPGYIIMLICNTLFLLVSVVFVYFADREVYEPTPFVPAMG